MSSARTLADLLDLTGDVKSDNLDNTSSTSTDIHAFKAGSNSDLLWEHNANLSLQDGNNQDSYLSVIAGSTDQSYSIDSNGNLICTF
jgi:hypothetical protein